MQRTDTETSIAWLWGHGHGHGTASERAASLPLQPPQQRDGETDSMKMILPDRTYLFSLPFSLSHRAWTWQLRLSLCLSGKGTVWCRSPANFFCRFRFNGCPIILCPLLVSGPRKLAAHKDNPNSHGTSRPKPHTARPGLLPVPRLLWLELMLGCCSCSCSCFCFCSCSWEVLDGIAISLDLDPLYRSSDWNTRACQRCNAAFPAIVLPPSSYSTAWLATAQVGHVGMSLPWTWTWTWMRRMLGPAKAHPPPPGRRAARVVRVQRRRSKIGLLKPYSMLARCKPRSKRQVLPPAAPRYDLLAAGLLSRTIPIAPPCCGRAPSPRPFSVGLTAPNLAVGIPVPYRHVKVLPAAPARKASRRLALLPEMRLMRDG